MNLHEALGQIAEIRAQVARTEAFRGFRSATVGLSGALGLAASLLQARRIPDPMRQLPEYLDLWGGMAVLSLVVAAAEMAYRSTVENSALKRRLTILAVQQFAPCLVAGGAVTLAITTNAPECAWMLPGLWAVLFGLGVFATYRLLPTATAWVGVHYLASGAVCLAMGNGPHALSPWFMLGTFGVGQFLAAGVLYYTLERNHERLEA
jgi:hypothetical protein